jgi:hypothetical protein
MANDSRGDRVWLVPAILIVVVILVMVGANFYIPELYDKPNGAGEFGDMFGGVNALFSGLAFVGVIYAILLQRRELQLQREELALTRTELARTAKAQEQSQISLSQQVQVMRTTSKLNALSALVENYATKIKATPVAQERVKYEQRQLEFLAMLEEELVGIIDKDTADEQ